MHRAGASRRQLHETLIAASPLGPCRDRDWIAPPSPCTRVAGGSSRDIQSRWTGDGIMPSPFINHSLRSAFAGAALLAASSAQAATLDFEGLTNPTTGARPLITHGYGGPGSRRGRRFRGNAHKPPVGAPLGSRGRQAMEPGRRDRDRAPVRQRCLGAITSTPLVDTRQIVAKGEVSTAPHDRDGALPRVRPLLIKWPVLTSTGHGATSWPGRSSTPHTRARRATRSAGTCAAAPRG